MVQMHTNCPQCGGGVTFAVGTAPVTVCPHCRSVVARTDRDLTTRGRVADLVPTSHLLALGMHGEFESRPFTIVGRTQYRHLAGGVWDEWYVSFDDETWGWLAEAQGRFYLTTEQTVPGSETNKRYIPLFPDLVLGGAIRLPAPLGHYTIAEVGIAMALSAEGTLPYAFKANVKFPYADLAGPNNTFGTVDYSESPPTVYLGRQLTFDQLGIVEQKEAIPDERLRVKGGKVNCPNCGGPLELVAPDQSERVACPYCASLLDCTQGELVYLTTLSKPERPPLIELGTTGTLRGESWTVIGYVERAVRFEGTTYPWSEYLLYDRRRGFAWLIDSERHWTFAQAVPIGNVTESLSAVHDRDREYKLFQRARAVVTAVQGEFYWKVYVGELVEVDDFIAPPWVISREVTRYDPDLSFLGEVNWSRGIYVPREEIAAAFQTKSLPRPGKMAPHQPSSFHPPVKPFLMAMAALLVVMTLLSLLLPNRRVLSASVNNLQATERLPQFSLHKPYKAVGEIRSTPDSTGVVEIKSVMPTTGIVNLITTVPMPTDSTKFGISVVADTNVRLDLTRQPTETGGRASVSVTVQEPADRSLLWMMIGGAIAAPFLLILILRSIEESTRWQDSVTSGAQDPRTEAMAEQSLPPASAAILTETVRASLLKAIESARHSRKKRIRVFSNKGTAEDEKAYAMDAFGSDDE